MVCGHVGFFVGFRHATAQRWLLGTGVKAAEQRKKQNGQLVWTVIGFVKGSFMITTIVMILLVLWLLGMLTSYTMGGVIHILLVVAIVVVLIRVIQGRRVV